jgi:beta-lactamase regulating signal transducer with metallopeptidase domain
MMHFERSITSLGFGITYFLQVAVAYLTTLSLCALIHNARVRVRIWGGFLAWAIATWILLWIPPQATRPVRSVLHSVPLPSTAELHVAVPVSNVWESYFARVAPTVTIVYLCLLLVSVLYWFLESRNLKSALRRTQPPSPQLQMCFERLCHDLQIGRCELRLVPELRSPATCYWWRSHVLLPLELVPHLDGDHLEDVLRHELFHVRQHDYLWDRLAALACRVVFFHPVVWLGYRHLRRERELACDYAVVRESSEARLRYAECLTDLTRWFMARRISSPGITFFSSESLLKVRVRALLSKPSVYSAPREAARAGLASIVAGVALLLLPSLGLSLYSPVRLHSLVRRPDPVPSYSVRKKGANAKSAHSSRSETLLAEAAQMTPQSVAQESIEAILDVPPAALPVLNTATAGEDTTSTRPTSANENAGLQSRHAVWDENPMPLASPPKWRTLAIGAITGAVGMATGQIDPDDIDGPHKRGR